MRLFLLLLSCVSVGAAVPGCHSDRDKDHRQRVNCPGAGFSDLPVGIEHTTKVLVFPNNLFSSLSWSSFQIFPEIYEIDLSGNKVPEVTPSSTPILPSLGVLRLGSNRLTSLSDGSFSACPSLMELHLENNSIQSLSDHTFSGLSKLEILDLSANRIKVLPDLMLHPLPAIETLFLEYNKIGLMPDNWFSQKEEVPYLFLSANPWKCSCSLDYLRGYLDSYEYNVYVRDGPILSSDAESVVCDSPKELKGKPIITLQESDLCSPATESGPTGDFHQPATEYDFYTTTAPTAAPTLTDAPTTISETTSSPLTDKTVVELYTSYHRVVTASWYQTFTRLSQWSGYSDSEVTVKGSLFGLHDLSAHPTLPVARHSTEIQAEPTKTPTSAPFTATSPTPRLQIDTTTTTEATTTSEATTTNKATTTTEQTTTKLIPWREVIDIQQSEKVSSVRAAGVFCIWLFAGCLLLCMASAACALATLATMIIWYRRVYRPLSATLARGGGGNNGVMLLTYNRMEGKEMGGEAVMALYRSILFIHREAGKGMEREDGGEGGEGEGKERQLITLEPTGGGAATREKEGERSGREEQRMYKKTLHRVLSKEEEIEGWREVIEECRVSEKDGGRRGGGQHQGMSGERSRGEEGASKKRYSVILREEREEAGGGREELDWVVGGWEVKRGGADAGEEPRSSWGEWLAHYLPSMPWGVTIPEGEPNL